MEWSLISLIIGFDPIYSKMNYLKRVQGVFKDDFSRSQKSRIQKIFEFCQKLPTYRIFITIEIFETFQLNKTCIFMFSKTL